MLECGHRIIGSLSWGGKRVGTLTVSTPTGFAEVWRCEHAHTGPDLAVRCALQALGIARAGGWVP